MKQAFLRAVLGVLLCCPAYSERYDVSRWSSVIGDPVPFKEGYLARDSVQGAGGWSYINPNAGTSELLLPESSASIIAKNDSIALFRIYRLAQQEVELWRTDGTSAGTSMYFTGESPALLESADPEIAFPAFLIDHRVADSFVELWISDGTQAGTKYVADYFDSSASESTWPKALGRAGEHLVWMKFGESKSDGPTLWACDGAAGTVTTLKSFPAVQDITKINAYSAFDYCYFILDNDGKELWRTDGTPGGTLRLTNLPFACCNAYFHKGNGLVALQLDEDLSSNPLSQQFVLSDGTPEGTRGFAPGVFSASDIQLIAPISSSCVFLASTGTEGVPVQVGYYDIDAGSFIDVFGPRVVTLDFKNQRAFLAEESSVVSEETIYFPLSANVKEMRGSETKQRNYVGLVKATKEFDSAELVSCPDVNDQSRFAASVIRPIADGFLVSELNWDLHVKRDGFCQFEADDVHTTDINRDFVISLSELLRVIQFYNFGGYTCAAPGEDTEDGYKPSLGISACAYHDLDYKVRDWKIDLSELLRAIQFYNAGAFHWCPKEYTEDGFCVGP